MNKKDKKYSIGLDIGTTSVGWSVIGEDKKLVKKGNDQLWGYDIFEEGKNAKTRRIARSTRRRYARRRQRINLLQDLCSEMICEVDDMFFKRLNLSYLVDEDRTEDFKNGGVLFFDAESDSDFYSRFKTIYHLRNYLINSKEKADPRLIYLALHHIVKYRGNFLYEGQNFSIEDTQDNALKNIQNACETLGIDTDYGLKLYHIVSNDNLPKKERQRYSKEISSVKEIKPILEEMAKALLGYVFKPGIIIGVDSEEKTSFKDSNYDSFMDEFSSENEELSEVIYELQSVYNSLVIKNILGHNKTISESMISIYEDHANDLRMLKELLSNHGALKMIVLGSESLYEKYINSPKEMSKDEIYKKLKEVLEKIDNCDIKNEILRKIENDSFLVKQNTTDNSAIPYQLNYLEAKMIIDNQKEYYPCLDRNEDKILSIISFKRPYYLGPSKGGDGTNNFAWEIRKSNEPLRPWNWKEVIDIDKTAEKFITRMLNHCTYILGEYNLPKNSIVLNRFNLLNELNKIKIDGKFLFRKRDEKERIINGLFLKKSKVTEKDLYNWLINNQIIVSTDTHTITGFQSEGGFASNLNSERSLRNVLGDKFNSNIDEVEKIIEYLTIYNDKEIIKRRLKNDIDIELTDEEIKRLMNLSFKGFGRFSNKLINKLISNNINGSPKTIIELMYDTNDNFMQIINKSEYGFMDQINELNNQGIEEFAYESVNKLSTSPANKRAIWQSIRVVEDIVKFMKHNPDNIFIEFARSSDKKVRTKSRYSQLEKIYEEYCDDYLKKELRENKDNLSNDAIYLYFLQQGKCLYSGKPLSLDDLDKYQIDHILPQSYIKDDSLENKALVITKENQRKKDSLLLDEEIIRKQKIWWKRLYECNLMGQKKYMNLIRTKLSDTEAKGFISRQLVETRQICVHVRNILKNVYPETNVGVVHAALSTEFRHKNNLYKLRELNNSHHANDAYLTAVIGQFIMEEMPYLFTNGDIETRYINKIIEERIKEESKYINGKPRTIYSYVINKMGDEPIFNADDELVWGGSKQIDYIKRIFKLKNYFYSYQTRDYDGPLYNATIYSALKNDSNSKASVNKKNNMPVDKYGGYSSIEKAYALAVEYNSKKKTKREVVDIPAIYSNDPEEYLKELLKTSEVKIIEKIRMGQVFIKDGITYTMSSATEWSVRQQIYIDSPFDEILYNISRKKYDLNTREEFIRLFAYLAKKISFNMPFLRKSISEKIYSGISIEEIDYGELLIETEKRFIDISDEDLAKASIDILNCVTSKKHPDFSIGGLKILSRFGRLSKKKIDLGDVVFVHTSPSGIFRTLKKI